MAIHHHFQSEDRGAVFKPAAMSIWRRKVITVTHPDDPGDQQYTKPGWGEETLEQYWYPLSLRWGSNGQISTLRIKVVLGQNDLKGRQRAEDNHCNPGDIIELHQIGPGLVQNWFTGYIGSEAMLIQAHPDVESVTLTAYGPELLLSHKVITGMWCANKDEALLGMKGDLTEALAIRSNVWEARLPVIMNPNGRGNAWGGVTSGAGATELNWQLTSHVEYPLGYTSSAIVNSCKVFTSPGATAGELVSEHWTAYTALRSVVEWVDDYNVISYGRTNWLGIENLLGDTPIGQVNLTGRNLLQAMNAILVPAGFGFALEPWRRSDGRYRLLVYKLHNPVSFAKVNMAPVVGGNVEMTSDAGQRAMVQRVDYLRDNHNVKNHIIVMGDTMITERSLDFDQNGTPAGVLWPAWDTAIHKIDDYDDGGIIGGGHWASASKETAWKQHFRLTSSNYLVFRDAFRTFAWNEDGGLSGIIQDGGGDPIIPTLTNYARGGAEQYAMYRPRPPKFRVKYATALMGSTAGALEPPVVFLGIAGDDDSWVKVPGAAYSLSKERCLIHFKVKDLAEWYPWKKEQNKSGGDTHHKLYGKLNFATALWNSLTVAGSKELVIRLTAGFEVDDSVYFEQTRLLDSSWPFDARAMVRMPKRFKYRDIEGSTGSGGAAVDDGLADGPMDLYGRKVQDALEDATGHGSVVLRGLHRAYYPGQGLRKLVGRNIDLTLAGRRQTKAASVAPVIAGITWHFVGGANKTELLLETGQLGLPD